ncbi:protein lin-52 homolog isoform X2 [Drosophila teissieri]|uniref:protein lin-52 homolog isoform X2 n=1 Tax=Drosophila teissieri TaxID=7243 RepID=UPI001CBA4108|nr:protein lin-52 homolog isoform X2 [Drosophila teissieri]
MATLCFLLTRWQVISPRIFCASFCVFFIRFGSFLEFSVMSTAETTTDLYSTETILKAADEEVEKASAASRSRLSAEEENPDGKEQPVTPEDELISMETLRPSPVQWPERFPGMDEFLTMSDTPIYTRSTDYANNLTIEDMAKINQLAQLTPEQLIENIKSMHDEIYQLGLREAKEMTRGKLLGIFDRDRVPKRQP